MGENCKLHKKHELLKFPTFIIFLLLSTKISFGQNLRLTDAWHNKRNDLNRDSLNSFLRNQKIHLKFNETINLQFSPKDSNQRVVEYEYRIVNANNFLNWIEIGKEPIIQFPNLDGGSYILEVREAKTTNAIRLPIIVEQNLWQKTWVWMAIGIYIIFLISIVIYFFLLYNLRQKLKLQDVRNRIAADLHDEVGSNLNSIAIFVEVLREKAPSEFKPLLDKIINNSTESVQLMQDTIWAIQPKNDDFQKFIDKMKGFSSEVLSAKNISLKFENQIDSSKNNLSMEQRKNAYLIFKEVINNIVKHSEATKVSVKISEVDNQILIEIEDNGCGFDTNMVFEGNGLKNFENRAEEHEMKVKIDSGIGFGTKVSLIIFVE